MTAAGQRGRHRDSTGARKATAVAEPWEVRDAQAADVPAAAAAVAELLVELGGEPPEASALQAEAQALTRPTRLLATSSSPSRHYRRPLRRRARGGGGR